MVNMIRLINLITCTSSHKSLQLKPFLTPYHNCGLIKRYSQHKGEGQEEIGKERASSTLEVMEQFSHEKEERISDEKCHRQSNSNAKMMDYDVEQVGGDEANSKNAKKNKKSSSATLP